MVLLDFTVAVLEKVLTFLWQVLLAKIAVATISNHGPGDTLPQFDDLPGNPLHRITRSQGNNLTKDFVPQDRRDGSIPMPAKRMHITATDRATKNAN
jgi:hypothetical protein